MTNSTCAHAGAFSSFNTMIQRSVVRHGARIIMCVALGWAVGFGHRVHADTATLGAAQDVTIYSSSGSVSNSGGQYCFTGNNAMGMSRRTLMRFDLSSIPAGSTITSVTLTLFMSMSNADAVNTTLHRVTNSWGEGNSVPSDNGGEGTAATTNDATWTRRFFNTISWTTPGGDFNATASATTAVDQEKFYNWSSAQMITDVQLWVNNPSTNFGWLIRGEESEHASTKRFDTKENPTVSQRPKLVVIYTPPAPPCTGEFTGDNTVGVPDLLFVINAWGPCANPSNCPADIAPPPIGDDAVGVPDLLAVINGWGPCQ